MRTENPLTRRTLLQSALLAPVALNASPLSNGGLAGGRRPAGRRHKGLAPVPPGNTLVFVGQATEPSVTGSMSAYVRHVGRVPAGFMFYLILSGDRARTRRELVTMQTFLDRYPGTALQLAVGYGAQLTGNAADSAQLLAGAYDAELRSLAQWLRSLDRAVFLRPLYEFDRACATYGQPQLYAPAYRYLVDRLREAGAGQNIAWVWHSAGPGYRLDDAGFYAVMGSLSARLGGALDPLLRAGQTAGVGADLCPIEDFYPGEGYVDYFAVSYWGQGSFLGPGTADARHRYEAATRRLLNRGRALGLPLMIAESTPAYVGTTSGRASLAWMRLYFDLIEEYDIRVVSYIATQWAKEGGNWGSPAFNGFFPPDARIHADPAVRELWLRRTGKRRYHQRSDTNINTLLKYRPTPRPLPWSATPESTRQRMRWPNCPPPQLPGTGGWCLPPAP